MCLEVVAGFATSERDRTTTPVTPARERESGRELVRGATPSSSYASHDVLELDLGHGS